MNNNCSGNNSRLFALAWPDYQLLDVGDGKKLERWGEIITIRPDIQANSSPGWPYQHWLDLAHWQFEEQSPTHGNWQCLKPDSPNQWVISYGLLNFGLKLTQFKHVGLFPEQQVNWRYIQEHIKKNRASVLNLFAYSGAASLVSCSAGADVVHVDSVKQMLTWANENRQRSALEGIQWVHEDALKFSHRELKRGKSYDGIIMNPPAWGIGAKGEKWKLENHLSELIETAFSLMSPGAFLIINTYSPKVQSAKLLEIARRLFNDSQIEMKQLWMLAKSGKELYCGNLLRAIK